MDAAKLSFGFRKKTGRKLAASCCSLTAVAWRRWRLRTAWHYLARRATA